MRSICERPKVMSDASPAIPSLPSLQISPPQPTMQTEKDIGSENPETTAVSGFFLPLFKVEFKRYISQKRPLERTRTKTLKTSDFLVNPLRISLKYVII